MALRTSAIAERLRSSLFFVPMLYVVGALVLGFVGVRFDKAILQNEADLPLELTSTVESARSVLATVAGATITVAGIAFSVSLLIIQLASSQYSPRVVPGLFRDPFNKRVMGVVVGTFTYCLIVLRAVRSSVDEGGDPVIPNVSVAAATVFGVVSIMAIVAFISHNAHAMDVSKILHNVTELAMRQVRQHWPEADEPSDDDRGEPATLVPPVDVLVVPLERHGWLQTIDLDALVSAADPGGTVRLETSVGRYAVAGTPLCSIWPRPADEEAARRNANRALVVGDTRTSPQDVAYGIRQLADVALKALSPGINDPTTAQDAMFHLGSVLRELLVRRPPRPRQQHAEGRTLILAKEPTHADLVGTAFDEVRIASADMPTMSVYLLELIHLLTISIDEQHLAAGGGEALLRQARLVRDGAEASDVLLPADRRRVLRACDDRFGVLTPAR